MPDIVLSTVTARYWHTAFGLRWLWANLGPLQSCAVIREFTLTQPPLEIVENLLAERPRIIGFSLHIWNVQHLTPVMQAIKKVAPEIVLVAGGPEASYEYENAAFFEAADYLVCGEGERAFVRLANAILSDAHPLEKVIVPPPPALDELTLPYTAYTDEDIARRTLYIETSRGCPFECEFCLSSLDARVREFALPTLFDALETLIARGGRKFNFIDRTFNLNTDRALEILSFFRTRWRDGMELHVEVAPDRLAPELLDAFAWFPPLALRLEAGVQSFTPCCLEAISRRQDLQATARNLRYLHAHTGAHLHADLIAGLPGETRESFADSFNSLHALAPHEIQVGLLKRLKGAPIARHETAGTLTFSQTPPYEVLQTSTMRFEDIQRIKRFARYYDLFANSGNFPSSLPRLLDASLSPFDAFMAFSDEIWRVTRRTHEFPLKTLSELLYRRLLDQKIATRDEAAALIRADFHRLPGRSDALTFLDEA